MGHQILLFVTELECRYFTRASSFFLLLINLLLRAVATKVLLALEVPTIFLSTKLSWSILILDVQVRGCPPLLRLQPPFYPWPSSNDFLLPLRLMRMASLSLLQVTAEWDDNIIFLCDDNCNWIELKYLHCLDWGGGHHYRCCSCHTLLLNETITLYISTELELPMTKINWLITNKIIARYLHKYPTY